FCPVLAANAKEIHATVYSETNVLTQGDICNFNTKWFTPNAGHMQLQCAGTTKMAAIPKDNYGSQGCTNCIYWQDEFSPNTSGTVWAHNLYGTHVMVRLLGQSAYGGGGIHWGYVNSGMSEGNAGDVQCGSKGSWCYEVYWGGNTSAKSMQLYLR